MKGWVFENLPALTEVNLASNECISQIFGSKELGRLSKTVNETCGIDKTETQIACEETWGQICGMHSYTTIKDIGYTISDSFNDAIRGISFDNNRNIDFLPNSPHQNFPKLTSYSAIRCSIKEISKANFEKLHWLTRISLFDNQIYAVLSDTFKDLTELQRISLSKFLLEQLNFFYLFDFI